MGGEDEGFVKTTLRKVSKALRRVIGGPKADQIEAGYRNDDLSLTQKGKEAVFAFFGEQEEVDNYLTSLAQEEILEAKEKCKK